jgi:hypothetical protein
MMSRVLGVFEALLFGLATFMVFAVATSAWPVNFATIAVAMWIGSFIHGVALDLTGPKGQGETVVLESVARALFPAPRSAVRS